MKHKCACGSNSWKRSVTSVPIFIQTPRQGVCSSGAWSVLSHQLPGVLFAACSRWAPFCHYNNCKINILLYIYVFDHTREGATRKSENCSNWQKLTLKMDCAASFNQQYFLWKAKTAESLFPSGHGARHVIKSVRLSVLKRVQQLDLLIRTVH